MSHKDVYDEIKKEQKVDWMSAPAGKQWPYKIEEYNVDAYQDCDGTICDNCTAPECLCVGDLDEEVDELEESGHGYLKRDPQNTQVGGDHYTKMEIDPLTLIETRYGVQAKRYALLVKIDKYVNRDKGDPVENIDKAIHCCHMLRDTYMKKEIPF